MDCHDVRRRTQVLLALAAISSAASCAGDVCDRAAGERPRPQPSAARLRVDVSQLRLAPLKARRFDPSDGLDPGEAAVLAVLNSPDLAAKRAIAHVAAAQAFPQACCPIRSWR